MAAVLDLERRHQVQHRAWGSYKAAKLPTKSKKKKSEKCDSK